MTSSGSVSVRAFVPTSSRLRTLTERVSSSSWPTTARRKFSTALQDTYKKIHTEDEVVLRDLAVADFLRERVLTVVDVHIQAGRAQLLRNLSSILPLFSKRQSPPTFIMSSEAYVGDSNRDNEHLARRDPERPLAREVLGDDRNEALHAAQDGAMDDDRARRGFASVGSLVRAAVLEVEALGQLEVKLDGRALVRALERVADSDVDLGPVERAVSGVDLPLARIELLKRAFQLLHREYRQHRIIRAMSIIRTSSAAFHVSILPR